MLKQTVPNDRSRDVEAAFAEFCGCPQHGQVTTSCRAETGIAAEIHYQACFKPGVEE